MKIIYHDGSRRWAGLPRIWVGPKQMSGCSLEEKWREKFGKLTRTMEASVHDRDVQMSHAPSQREGDCQVPNKEGIGWQAIQSICISSQAQRSVLITGSDILGGAVSKTIWMGSRTLTPTLLSHPSSIRPTRLVWPPSKLAFFLFFFFVVEKKILYENSSSERLQVHKEFKPLHQRQ